MRGVRSNRARTAFTLIELLIVIAIIAILVGLLTAGVIKVMDKIAVTQTSNEITQLSQAVENFKAKYKVYPPSRILLSNNPADYAADPTSLAYLNAIWPRLVIGSPGFDWLGGAGLPGPVVLEGDQCLVFFLGGIPSFPTTGFPGCLGFASNPTNPTLSPANPLAGTRVGPFFDFQTQRLVDQPHPASPLPSPSGLFLSYWDNYQNTQFVGGVKWFSVYAYFSSGKLKNAYKSDCPSLVALTPPGVLPVVPYFQATGQFYNPSSVQIISAGRDGWFGPGGLWLAANAPVNALPNGLDDQTNFYDSLMGVAP
jgi:prepilin-type N-terminal cleavage/methylation domain-containing protein